MSDNPFKIVSGEEELKGAIPLVNLDKSKEIEQQIKALLSENNIIIFIKGTANAPMCGFSANSTAILNSFNITYKTFNILDDPEIRENLKKHSNWPTYPQLYIKGELVGGNDIITEMYRSGELEEFLKKNT